LTFYIHSIIYLLWWVIIRKITVVFWIKVLLIFVISDSVRKLKTQNIIFVEAIALESVYDNRCLQSRFEISKAENNFIARFLFTRNQTNSLVTRKGSKNVRNFSFRCIKRNAFNINSVCSIFWNRENWRLIESSLEVWL
jgi:hypothetical protein